MAKLHVKVKVVIVMLNHCGPQDMIALSVVYSIGGIIMPLSNNFWVFFKHIPWEIPFDQLMTGMPGIYISLVVTSVSSVLFQ